MQTLTEREDLLERTGWIRWQDAPDENALWSHPTWVMDEERVTTGEAMAMAALERLG